MRGFMEGKEIEREDDGRAALAVADPGPTASYCDTDAWLTARGWTNEDKIRWRSVHRGRVTEATYNEAAKIQRRRDRAAKRGGGELDRAKLLLRRWQDWSRTQPGMTDGLFADTEEFLRDRADHGPEVR